MKTEIRLVRFDPGNTGHAVFTIGALVRQEGNCRFVPAQRLPRIPCLSPSDLFVLDAVLATLPDGNNWEAPPAGVGPCISYAEPLFPHGRTGVKDSWVRKNLLPSKATSAGAFPRSRRRRDGEGKRFFERYGLVGQIRNRFQPGLSTLPWIRRRASVLRPVTHWVPGDSATLLMEPLIGGRQDAEDIAQTLATRFAAYRWARAGTDDVGGTKLVGYILAGGKAERRSNAVSILEQSADLVFDLAHEHQRLSLVGLVEEVAKTASGTQLEA